MAFELLADAPYVRRVREEDENAPARPLAEPADEAADVVEVGVLVPPDRRGVARNTVQTQIVRLEEKGWLTRKEGTSGFLYAPTVSRKESQKSSVQQLIETVFDHSPEGLVLTLLNGGTLSRSEAERIRKLITDARRKKP